MHTTLILRYLFCHYMLLDMCLRYNIIDTHLGEELMLSIEEAQIPDGLEILRTH